MAVLCELLGGALAASLTQHDGETGKKSILNGMLSVLIDPAALGGQGRVERQAQVFVDWVLASPPREGFEPVRLAGYPERGVARRGPPGPGAGAGRRHDLAADSRRGRDAGCRAGGRANCGRAGLSGCRLIRCFAGRSPWHRQPGCRAAGLGCTPVRRGGMVTFAMASGGRSALHEVPPSACRPRARAVGEPAPFAMARDGSLAAAVRLLYGFAAPGRAAGAGRQPPPAPHLRRCCRPDALRHVAGALWRARLCAVRSRGTDWAGARVRRDYVRSTSDPAQALHAAARNCWPAAPLRGRLARRRAAADWRCRRHSQRRASCDISRRAESPL